MAEKRLSIQKILLPDKEPQASQWNLYYQGAEMVCDLSKDGTSRLLMGCFKEYNFCSYFNAISLEKWKKYTNIKNMPVIHIHIISGEKEKMIPVYYLEEIRCAYISEATYNKHKNEIDAFFK